MLAVGESGEEGSQESNRELRAGGDPEVEEHLVAVLASTRLAVREGRVVAREGGKFLLRLLLAKRLVFTEPNRLGNEGYEAVEVDALVWRSRAAEWPEARRPTGRGPGWSCR